MQLLSSAGDSQRSSCLYLCQSYRDGSPGASGDADKEVSGHCQAADGGFYKRSVQGHRSVPDSEAAGQRRVGGSAEERQFSGNIRELHQRIGKLYPERLAPGGQAQGDHAEEPESRVGSDERQRTDGVFRIRKHF